MKRSFFIALLTALILTASFSFAAYGKDDYETPVIPVTSATQEAATTDPYETPVIPGSSTPTDSSAPAATDSPETPSAGVAAMLMQALTALLALLRRAISFLGGLFA